MNLKRIPYILAFLLLFAVEAFSQTAPDCPPENPNCPWEPFSYEMPLTQSGGTKAVVTGRKRICNGQVEVVYDNVQAIRNSMFLEEDSYFEKNFSALRELIDLNMIENAEALFGINIPYCPELVSIFKMYAANSGVWVKCSYEVNPASESCDAGYEMPSPMYNKGGRYWVDVYKWQSCGTACCRKDYKVCKEYAPDKYDVIINIVNMSKGPISPCTREGEFKDWKTGNVIPCKAGC
jgi:hypothetical protein